MCTEPKLAARSVVALAVILCGLSCAAAEAPVSFATAGGEAWTFQKPIELSVVPGQCDEVRITSPAGIMLAHPQGGHVLLRVPLIAGDNPVEAECRKKMLPVGAPIHQDWHVRLADVPKARVRIVPSAEGLLLDGGASELAPARAAPISRYAWWPKADNPSPLLGLPQAGRQIVLPVPARDGDYFVTLQVTDDLRRSDTSTAGFRVRGGEVRPLEPSEHATWINDAVVYGVMPALFGPRGLSEVTAHLDALVALGVNTVWLPPITASPPGDFGYALSDHFRVRPSLGGDGELHRLIETAHARGLRVLLDLVLNHVSEQHAYYVDVQTQAYSSPYWDFFARTSAGTPAFYFNWTNLKNLNFDNPEVQRMIIEASAYWVREFDVDGFRVDAAWGPRQRAPEFWRRWRDELKRIKPNLLLLAEAPSHDPYYDANGFDATYDWTDKLGEWAWRSAFDDVAHTAARLRTAIGASLSEGLVFRFLNNNDTDARFVTRYGVERARLAAALLLTLPGLPEIYSGEEVGAEYEPYRDRAAISWEDPHDLTSWYRRLIAMRHELPALRTPALQWVDVPEADQLLAYLRPAPEPGQSIAVVLNFAETWQSFSPPNSVIEAIAPDGRTLDLVSGKNADLRSGALALAPTSVRILKAMGP